MNFTNIIERIILWIANAFLSLVEIGSEQAIAAKKDLIRGLKWNLIGGGAGFLLACYGYRAESDSLLYAGKFITALMALVAGGLYIMAAVRIGLIAGTIGQAMDVVNKSEKTIATITPGGPYNVPPIFKEDYSQKALQMIGAALGAIFFANAYIALVPFYKNPVIFLGVLLLGMGVVFGILFWNLRTVFPVKDYIVRTAGFLIIAFTVWLIVPLSFWNTVTAPFDRWTDRHELTREVQKDVLGEHQMVQKSSLKTLYLQRLSKIRTLSRVPPGSEDALILTQDIALLNQRIEALESGELLTLEPKPEYDNDYSSFWYIMPKWFWTIVLGLASIIILFGLASLVLNWSAETPKEKEKGK